MNFCRRRSSFDYLYHNFQGKPDEEIKEISNPLTSAAILVMKHYFDQGYLLKNLEFFLVSSVDDYGNLYRPLIVYLFEKVPEGSEETLEAISNLPSSIKSEVMSILEAYEARGEARGEAKGEIKGISQKTRQTCINMIRKGFDNLTICEVLEVSDDYVEKVRKELN